jgi:hypothetical protein
MGCRKINTNMKVTFQPIKTNRKALSFVKQVDHYSINQRKTDHHPPKLPNILPKFVLSWNTTAQYGILPITLSSI